MTVELALAILLAFLALLVLLSVPQAPRLFRHGNAPARPRRYWLPLLVTRELGTAGAAAAATWAALASPGPLPAWVAGALAGGLAYLAVETLAPRLGLLLPDDLADRAAELVSRTIAVFRRPLERPAVVLAGWLAGEGGLARQSVLRFVADGRVEEGEEAALEAGGRALRSRGRALSPPPGPAGLTPPLR